MTVQCVYSRISLLHKSTSASKLRQTDGSPVLPAREIGKVEQQQAADQGNEPHNDTNSDVPEHRSSSLSPSPEVANPAAIESMPAPTSPVDDMMAALRRAKGGRASMSLQR